MRKSYLILALLLGASICPAQISFQWAGYYNGPGDFTEQVNCATRDAAGNVYLGGAAIYPNANLDYRVIKLDVAGDTVWTWSMDGADNGVDEILAIAVDATGRVAVTGSSNGINTGDDALTVLLDANGAMVWATAYNNSLGNEDDLGVSVAFTPNGSVAVCGYGDRDPEATTNNDFFIAQYDASGMPTWVQTYNGTGNDNDRAADLAVDASGNVYVAGRTDNGADDDYVTLKYNDSGVQQWIRSINFGATDRATCIGIDPSGNVIVSGRSDVGPDDDFYTIKYDPAGTQLWVRAANFVDDDRARFLVIDAAGAVYVTGQSDADAGDNRNWDFLTLKYDAAGTQVWSMRYSGAGLQYDFPNGIALDDNGQVYVTGYASDTAENSMSYDIETVSYDGSSGNQLWAQVYAGAAGESDAGTAVVGRSSGCIVGGTSYSTFHQLDGMTLRYDNTGSLQAETRYYGPGDRNDNLNAMAVDGAGQVSVAGYQTQAGQDRNIFYLRLNSNGTGECFQEFSGTSTPSPDVSQGISIDATGNAMIAGYVKNTDESFALAWIKFDALCDTQFTKKYNATAYGSDKIYDMVGGSSGDIYITGKVDADATYQGENDNCFTAKINASGAIVWSRSYGSAGVQEDRGEKVVVSAAGNTYVLGRSLIAGNYDLFLVKYDALGIQQWAQTWSGAFGNDEPDDLAVDAFDNIYIAARTEETAAGQYDYVTLKYDATGALVWARTYNGLGAGDDRPQALGVDGVGNVFVTGRADIDPTAAENLDIVTLKYDPIGDLSWTHTLGDLADDNADDLVVSPIGNVYVTGHINKGSIAQSQYDIETFILDHTGNVLWQDSYDGLGSSDDIPNRMLLQGNDIYVGGSAVIPGQDKDILVLKYSGIVGTSNPELGGQIALFPNPTQGQVTIRNSGKPMKNARLMVTDETGHVLLENSLWSDRDTEIFIGHLPAGLYIYTVSQGDQIVARGKIARF